jgi:hypothetical protein
LPTEKSFATLTGDRNNGVRKRQKGNWLSLKKNLLFFILGVLANFWQLDDAIKIFLHQCRSRAVS